MRILAIDTSSNCASVAISDNGKLAGEFFINTGLNHSKTIMLMLSSLMEQTQIKEFDLFAVCAGPGSFTGLRIGIAAVKGLAFGYKKECASISSLEGLAYNMIDTDAVIVPVIDARCSNVYTAMFRIKDREIHRLSEDSLMSIQTLKGQISHIKDNIYIVGNAAVICYNKFKDTSNIFLAPSYALEARAWGICQAAMKCTPISSAELAPVYLSIPQAQKELEKRMSE